MVRLADILVELDRVADAIEAQQQIMTVTNTCCDDSVPFNPGDVDEVIDDVGDVPQNIIDSGYATGTTDWTGWREYKCMIAHLFLSAVINKLSDFKQLSDAGILYAGGAAALVGLVKLFALTAVGAAIISVPLLGTFAVAAGLFAILSGLTSAQLEAWQVDLENARNDLTCAIYNGDGTGGALGAFYMEVDELNATLGQLVRNMNLWPLFAGLYGGRIGETDVAAILAGASYDVDDYECCVEPLGPAVGMIAVLIGTCTTHAVGDIVYENQDVSFQSVHVGTPGYERCGMILKNVAGNGYVLPALWTMTAMSGWASFGTIDRYWYWRSASYPYYASGDDNDFNFGQAVPYTFSMGANYAGYQVRSANGSTFTCTMRVELT